MSNSKIIGFVDNTGDEGTKSGVFSETEIYDLKSKDLYPTKFTGPVLGWTQPGTPRLRVQSRLDSTGDFADVYTGSPLFETTPVFDNLPGSSVLGARFDPTGAYLAVGLNATPFLLLYKRNYKTFTKITSPTLSARSAGSIAWNYDGSLLAFGLQTASIGRIVIYQRTGDTLTLLHDRSTGLGTPNELKFHPKTNLLFLSHADDNYIRTLFVTTSSLTYFSDLQSIEQPWDVNQSMDIDPTGKVIATGNSNSPGGRNIRLYYLSELLQPINPGSVYFPGTSNSYLAVNGMVDYYTSSTSAFTFETYTYRTSETTATCIFSLAQKISSTTVAPYLSFYPQHIYINNVAYAHGITYDLNTWTHSAIVYNGADLKIYKDGVLSYTNTGILFNQAYGGFSGPSTDLRSLFAIGANYASTSTVDNLFVGYISNFRAATKAVYTGTFTLSEGTLPAVDYAKQNQIELLTDDVVLLACQSTSTFTINHSNSFDITLTNPAGSGLTAVSTSSPFLQPAGNYSLSFPGSSWLFTTSTYTTSFPLHGPGWTLEMWVNGVLGVRLYYSTAGTAGPALDQGWAQANVNYGIGAGYGWYHVLWQYENGAGKTYINGRASDTFTRVATAVTGTVTISIGTFNNSGGGGWIFNGNLYNIRETRDQALIRGDYFVPTIKPLTTSTVGHTGYIIGGTSTVASSITGTVILLMGNGPTPKVDQSIVGQVFTTVGTVSSSTSLPINVYGKTGGWATTVNSTTSLRYNRRGDYLLASGGDAEGVRILLHQVSPTRDALTRVTSLATEPTIGTQSTINQGTGWTADDQVFGIAIDGASSNSANIRYYRKTQVIGTTYNIATSFDGKTTGLTIANTSTIRLGTSPFTIEAYIYLNVINQIHPIILSGERNVTNNRFTLQVATDNTLEFIDGTTSYKFTAMTFVPNSWCHIAVTRSAGLDLGMYVNGISSGIIANVTTDYNDAYNAIRIGIDRAPNPVNYFNGYISNLRIVKGYALYSEIFNPPSVQLDRSLASTATNSTVGFGKSIYFGNNSSDFSYYFTGTQYLTIDNTSLISLPYLGKFTIEMWLYFTGTLSNYTAGAGPILQKGTRYTNDFEFGVSLLYVSASTARLDFQIGDPTGSAYYSNTSTNFTFNNSTWYHLAVSGVSNSISFYVNGTANGNATTTATGYFSTSTSLFSIGNNYLGTSTNYTGYISNLRIVRDTQVYTGAFSGITSSLSIIQPPATNISALYGDETILLTLRDAYLIDKSVNNFAINNRGVSPSSLDPFTVSTSSVFAIGEVFGGSVSSFSISLNGTSQNLWFTNTTDTTLYNGDFTFETWMKLNSLPSTSTTYLKTYSLGLFDGSTSNLETSAQSAATYFGTGDFTMEAWVYLTSTPATNGCIFSVVSDWQVSWNTVAGVGLFNYLNKTTGKTNDVSTTQINLNTWYHIAVQRSSGTSSMWTNGVNTGVNYSESENYTSVNPIRIGINRGSNAYFPGYMSNIRIVKGQALFSGTFTPSTVELTLNKINHTGNVTNSGNISGTVILLTGQVGDSINGGVDDLSYTFTNPLTGSSVGFINTTYYPDLNTTYPLNGYTLMDQQGGLGVGVSTTATGIITYRTSSTEFSSSVVNSYPFTWNTGTWYHVAVVKSNGLQTVYVDGANIGSTTDSNNYSSAGNRTYIGRNSKVGQRYFAGSLSNIRLVKGYAIYGQGFSPPNSSLTTASGTVVLIGNVSSIKDSSIYGRSIATVSSPATSTVNPFSFYRGEFFGSGGILVQTTELQGYGSVFFNGSGGTSGALLYQAGSVDVGTSDFTFESWVYATASVSNFTNPWYYGSYASSVSAFGISGYNGTVDMVTNAGGTANVYVYGPTWNLNQWYHVAIIRSFGALKFFVDGVYIGQNTALGTYNFTGVSGIRIGAGGYDPINSNTYPFTGYVSNFRIVTTAVYTTSTSNFTKPTTPLKPIANTLLLTAYDPYSYADFSGNNRSMTCNTATTTVIPFTAPTAIQTRLYDRAFQLETWFYPSSTATTQTIFDARSTDDTNNASFDLYMSNAKVYFGSSSTTYITGTTVISPLNWYHVSIVRTASAGSITMYLNGVKDGNIYTASATQSFTNHNYKIGYGTRGAFTGYISNLRIIKGKYLYTGNFIPPSYTLTRFQTTATNNIVGKLAGTETTLLLFTTSTVGNASITNTTASSIVNNGSVAIKSTESPYYGTYSGYYDGSTNYSEIVNSGSKLDLGLADFTVEMNVNATTVAATNSMPFFYGNYGGTTAGNNGFFLTTLSSKVQLGIVTTGSTIVYADSGVAWAPGLWYNLAVTRSSGVFNLYVNGSLKVASTQTVNFINVPGIRIGAGDSNATTFAPAYYWPGYINNLRVIKGQAIYTGNYIPPSSPLQVKQNTSTNTLALSGTETTILGLLSSTFVDYSTTTFTLTQYLSPSTAIQQSSSLVDLSFGIGDFTLECWYYWTGDIPNTAVEYTLMSNLSAASNVTWNLKYFSGWKFSGATTNFISSAVLNMTTSTWNHIAVTRWGSTGTIWLNGISLATGAAFTTNFSLNSIVRLGWDGVHQSWPGYISNARIVRSVAEYKGPFTPSTTALAVDTANDTILLTAQSSTLIDNSNYGLTLGTTGNVSVGRENNPFGYYRNYTSFIPSNIDGSDVTTFLGLQRDIVGDEYTRDHSKYSHTVNTVGYPRPINNSPFILPRWSLDLSSNSLIQADWALDSFTSLNNDWTIEFWCYRTIDNNGPDTYFNIKSSTGAVFNFAFTTDNITIANVTYTHSMPTAVLNIWKHYAFTCQGGNIFNVYIDGNKEGTYAGTLLEPLINSTFIVGGEKVTVGYTYITGYFNSLRVTGKVVYYDNFNPIEFPPRITQSASTGIAEILPNECRLLTLQADLLTDQAQGLTVTWIGQNTTTYADPLFVSENPWSTSIVDTDPSFTSPTLPAIDNNNDFTTMEFLPINEV